MADVNHTEMNHLNGTNPPREFLSGVVEGFYGRPWTTEQRKDLFCKQQKWGMNCYLYAPKDDYKHRTYWRELYTVEEAEHLQALIDEARKHNIVFYYAISPGLDIVYSSQKEISCLKRKLEQVQQLGCSAFALLFDDIDPEMSMADKEVYQSFAHAQVSVANEVYAYLDQPKFMFCPTQYCSTRAVPTVQTSEYLNTLGAKLAPEINIMWTGPKVISKTLTVEHIREVSTVLKRPPVIWDNLHANDYDQARLFLGPYCGRSTSLIPLLSGVVTNPNCEYGPNFIAIHTLAQWSRSAAEDTCADSAELKDDAVSADIRLETEGDDISSSYCPTGLPSSTYHPRRALRIALQDWRHEFSRSVQAAGPIQQPHQIPTPAPIPIMPSVNTCMSITSTTTPVLSSLPTIATSIAQVAEVIQDSSLVPPSSSVVMNSLVSENKIGTILPAQLPVSSNLASPQDGGDGGGGGVSSSSSAEPMECTNYSPISSLNNSGANADTCEDHQMVVEPAKSDTASDGHLSPTSPPQAADVDLSQSPSSSAVDESITKTDDLDLTIDDLLLLADLFYLPFEHGKKGITIMTEFNWLKSNSHLVIEHNRNHADGTQKPEVAEWFAKQIKFRELSESVKRLSERLFHIRNRSLLYELYPYVWDMRGVVSLLNSYVTWLALGQVSSLVSNFVHGNYTWFSKGWREAFTSGDQEPWIFRGGLTAELQRMIPVDAPNDLFLYKAPEEILNKCYVIRPYLDTDKTALYSLVLQTADDGKDATHLYEAHPQLTGDVHVGSFLISECKERVLMVVEDEKSELVAYCFAAPNAKEQEALHIQHIVQIRDNYPKVVREEGTLLSACEQLLASLWDNPPFLPATTPITPPVGLVNISHITPFSIFSQASHLVVLPAAMSQGSSSLVSQPLEASNSNTTTVASSNIIVTRSLTTSISSVVPISTTLVSNNISNNNTEKMSSSTPPSNSPTNSSSAEEAISSTTTTTTTASIGGADAPVTSSDSTVKSTPVNNPLVITPLTPSPTPSPDLINVNGAVARVAATAAIRLVAPPPTPIGDMLRYYPAIIRFAILPSVMDESILKRLITCILASLRAKGGFGGHICLSKLQKNTLELCSKVGFNQLGSVGETIYLTRSF